jgi:phosphatidylglycerophosphatase A
MIKFFRNLLVSFFFIGYIPYAPGTMASIVAALLYYFFLPELSVSGNLLFLLCIIVISLAFLPLIYRTEKEQGSDSQKIVIDEVIGYAVAVLFLPHTVSVAIYALILFRVFDILKPPPVYQVQDLPYGVGVIADDIVAGLYSNIIIQILYLISPKFFV